MIAQFAALRSGEDVFDEDDETFDKCRALNKKGRRCGLFAQSDALAALEELTSVTNLGNIEKRDELLLRFVKASHCSQHHGKGAVRFFDEWRLEQQGAADSDDDTTLDTAGSSEVDAEAHYTCRKTPSSLEEETPRRLKLPEQPKHQRDSPEVQPEQDSQETLVEAVANITIADNQPAATPQKTIIITRETHIEGLGVTDLRRRGSVRDKSLVLKEIYKHPTAEDMKTGVVYILRHRRIKNLFKVGYTKKTAQRRHSDANNCYGTDTDVVYETEGGPFAGSFKAEKIAHCILEEQKLWVKKCEQCDRSHREWFMAEFEVVLQAVQLAEKFLRLPAYDTVDGEMKLSAKAHAMLEPLIFNVDKLEVILASQKTEVQVVETQVDGSETITRTIDKNVTVTSIEAVGPEDTAPAEQEQVGRKLRSQNLGGRIGNWGNKAKKAVRKFSNPVSRGASPEVEEGGMAQTPASTEELFVKLTWAVMPEEVKASYAGASSGRPRAFSDLKDTVRQYGRDFGEAFNAAMREREGKDVPAAKA
ncbi:hypothetical protein B0T11DRAFT_345058 [Plectosphaerella cucumerina]|uniref:Bacteriophage T5 Orf172 DNA-binding domain-containing protein n=1 Tax=Plectosphaerella cucumerina TaxID=40658 RepID=A0A8K0X918_9PEZI|nr:hypothetical protein B0T11DRAFT_345058 [Plectosphaerella cucumerina]